MLEKRVPAAFYKSANGSEPVRVWLKSLGPEDRKIIGEDIKTLEYGWPRGMPLCRSISSHKGLWEIRSRLAGGRSARVLFCITGGHLVLLHGFIKKMRRIPKSDLDLAARRLKEIVE